MKKYLGNLAMGFIHFSNTLFAGFLLGIIIGVAFSIFSFINGSSVKVVSFMYKVPLWAFILFSFIFTFIIVWLSSLDLKKKYYIRESQKVVNYATLFSFIIALISWVSSLAIYGFGFINFKNVSFAIISIGSFYLFSRILIKQDFVLNNDTELQKDSFLKTSKIRLVLFVIFVSLFILGQIVNIFKYSQSLNVQNSEFNNIEYQLEINPYVDDKVGFSLNIPKSWKIDDVSKEGDILYVIHDPMLTFTSGLLIMVAPVNKEDLVIINDTKYQDNFIKILSLITEKQGLKIADTNRISSSTVVVSLRPTTDKAISVKNTATVHFTNNGIFVLITSLSELDRQDPVSNLLSSSVNTFKTFPISPGMRTSSTEKLTRTTNETKTYTSDKFRYSFQYPMNWDWEATFSSTDYHDLASFVYQDKYLKGPMKQANINFSVRNYKSEEDNQTKLNSDIENFLSMVDKKTAITRNINLLPKNIPTDVRVEVIQMEQFEPFADGTRRTTTNLYLFAVRGDNHYRYNFKADSEDYESIYPLAVSIMRSMVFR